MGSEMCIRDRTEGELKNAVGQTVAVQNAILDEMKRILAAMNDSESFQEIINDLLEVKQGLIDVKKGIKNAQKPEEGVFEEKDIFE